MLIAEENSQNSNLRFYLKKQTNKKSKTQETKENYKE